MDSIQAPSARSGSGADQILSNCIPYCCQRRPKPSSLVNPFPTTPPFPVLSINYTYTYMHSGLSDAKDLPFFRKMHPDVLIKTGNETRSSSVTRRSTLPSIPPTKSNSTFGMPSAHRSAEVIRSFGPEEPPVKYLVQGAYQDEWVRKNLEVEVSGGSRQRPYIPPQPTKAALGHSLGAARYLQPPNDDEPWKINKFKTVRGVGCDINLTA